LATFATPVLLNSRIVPIHRVHKRIMAGMRYTSLGVSHDNAGCRGDPAGYECWRVTPKPKLIRL
jgi:hypothetical protein